MQPEMTVRAICFETNDLLVEVEEAFLMVDIRKYTDDSGRLVLPECAHSMAAWVHFDLHGQEWMLPLGQNVSDRALIRPDHRAGTEKPVLTDRVLQ